MAHAPSSITLTNVGVTWPDGTIALRGISGAFSSARTGLTGSNGSGKSTLLRVIAGHLAPSIGSVSLTGDVGWLRQGLPLDGGTVADALGVAVKLAALRAIENGDVRQENFDAVGDDWDIEHRIQDALRDSGLPGLAPDHPLAQVSGGESILLGLAGLRLAAHPITLLDEPTNNLDRDARSRLYEALSTWRGTLVVVSHDRQLLDLMDETAELRDGSLTVFGGNLSAYEEYVALEQEAAARSVRAAEQHLKTERRQLVEAQVKLARRARSARAAQLSGSLPRIVAGGKKNAAEVSAGKLRGEAEGKIEAAAASLEQAEGRLREDRRIHVDLPDPAVSSRRQILRFDTPTGDVIVQGPERIALVGPNGSGKTTLLNAVAGVTTGRNPAVEVTVHVDRVGYLPQRIRLDDDATVLDVVRAAAPGSPSGEVRSRLARFLFRGDAADRQVSTLSGGQRFRAALAALLLADPPAQLLLLDEPTNSLDLASVDQLVDALRAYSGAMIVVSHDFDFLSRLGVERWLELDTGGLREILDPTMGA